VGVVKGGDESTEPALSKAAHDGGADARLLHGGLLRDSAIVLGATTALLYLVGHVYCGIYLSLFGVRSGFAGLTLENLGMLGANSLAVFTGSAMTVWMLLGTIDLAGFRRTKIVRPIATVFVLIISVTPTLVLLDNGARPPLETWVHLIVSVTLCILTYPVRRRLDKFDEEADQLKADAETVAADLKAMVREMGVDPSADDRRNAELARTRVDSLMKQIRGLRSHVKWRRRLGTAYIAAFIGLPTACFLDASQVVDDDQWQIVRAEAAPRVPVYWSGDRLVFLTKEQGRCFVSVETGETLRSKQRCSGFIARIVED
jgi:hypothetical protein